MPHMPGFWARGDAVVVVTAGVLTKASALRKLFEGHKAAVAAPIYDDPPTEDEVAAWLADAGLRAVPPAAMRDLMALSRALDPGDAAGLVHARQHPATEDVAVGVGVGRHRADADREHAARRGVAVCHDENVLRLWRHLTGSRNRVKTCLGETPQRR